MFKTVRTDYLSMTQEQFSKASGVPMRTVVRLDADEPAHPTTVEVAARAMLKLKVPPRTVKKFLLAQQQLCRRCSGIDDLKDELFGEDK